MRSGYGDCPVTHRRRVRWFSQRPTTVKCERAQSIVLSPWLEAMHRYLGPRVSETAQFLPKAEARAFVCWFPLDNMVVELRHIERRVTSEGLPEPASTQRSGARRRRGSTTYRDMRRRGYSGALAAKYHRKRDHTCSQSTSSTFQLS